MSDELKKISTVVTFLTAFEVEFLHSMCKPHNRLFGDFVSLWEFS